MRSGLIAALTNLYERDDTTDMESPKTGTVDEAPGAAFTSEKFKIQLKNLPRSSNVAEIRTIIKKSKARPVKVKKGQGATHAFLTFRSFEERDSAIEYFNKMTYRGQTLAAAPAAQFEDRKRNFPTLDARHNSKRQRRNGTEIPLWEQLCDKVTPLWRHDYDKQLILKRDLLRKKLKAISNELYKVMQHTNVSPAWLNHSRKLNGGLICPLENLIPSPRLDGYRNKCEFTVGPNGEGRATVGHLLGGYDEGLQVVEPGTCKHISDTTKAVCTCLQDYIRASSLPMYDRSTHEGMWRMVTIRTTELGRTTAIISYQARQTPTKEVDKLREYVLEFIKNGLPLHSLLLQQNSSLSGSASEADPVTVVIGDEHVVEELAGLKFRVSPQAFFQVNTKAAEILIDVIRDRCIIDSETTLLDVCCGTGTIGIALAGRVKRVIGVDICHEAIIDARINATLNGVANINHIDGKAEDTIGAIMDDCAKFGGPVMAVVDPPRNGLQKSVVMALRKHEHIHRLVYISCNITGAKDNVVDLQRSESKKFRGRPFRLVQTTPVDLFPHTDHCELVMVFEREGPATRWPEWHTGVSLGSLESTVTPATAVIQTE